MSRLVPESSSHLAWTNCMMLRQAAEAGSYRALNEAKTVAWQCGGRRIDPILPCNGAYVVDRRRVHVSWLLETTYMSSSLPSQPKGPDSLCCKSIQQFNLSTEASNRSASTPRHRLSRVV